MLHSSFTCRVQFDFNPKQAEPRPQEDFLVVHERRVPLAIFRNARARRYLLRLCPDGSARLTIPRRGSVSEGRRFAESNTEWLARQLAGLPAHPIKPPQWLIGTELYFRGELVKLEPEMNGKSSTVRFGDQRITVPDINGDLRPWIAKHLWKLASGELPCRVFELAAAHQLTVQRVTVRNQRSRWGSCSRRATISLNWRLIQTRSFVRDYIILHELMHLRQMNHSARFWREVERVCPEYETAEKWLKLHASLLK
ncbi:MAG: metal-dependent hydrolase [Pedosphaera sp.]|nr:metal-dependent hydrolase [Pedosphaera sp.]